MAKEQEFINELKKMFGRRVWDSDERKKNYGYSDAICLIECEGEYSDLEYYEHYWGTDEFNELVKKYNYHPEWIDSCIMGIFCW